MAKMRGVEKQCTYSFDDMHMYSVAHYASTHAQFPYFTTHAAKLPLLRMRSFHNCT